MAWKLDGLEPNERPNALKAIRLSMSLSASRIIPGYVRKLLCIGTVPQTLLPAKDSTIEKIWFANGESPEFSHAFVAEKVDCIVLVQSDWNQKRLRACLEHLMGVLNGHGQLSILVTNHQVVPEDEKQLDDLLSQYDLIRYHSGPFTEDGTSSPTWALTAVARAYNPVLHARQSAHHGRPDDAIEIIDMIPSNLIDNQDLLAGLSLEKQKFHLQWQQKRVARYESKRRTPASCCFSPESHALRSSWKEGIISKSAAVKPTIVPANSLYLGLIKGENYGWGVCSRYLIKELSKERPVAVLNTEDGSSENLSLSGMLFQALTNVDFDPMFPKARAQRNFGYTFFENELSERSRERAKHFDKVLGGSTWCVERMIEHGITNCDVLIQGIDPEIFSPIDEPPDPERFVIFSGGKFELRKGQDLVLRAVKIMQDKYPDVWLVNCWYNLWPDSTRLMSYSSHIRFEHRNKETWSDTMARTYADNGLDGRRIVTCELMPQNLQRDLFSRTDIGLFPNRCEGGTNLVLMEYMACGKPVIASNASGHKDILNENNALLLNRLSPFMVKDNKGALIAKWQEPSLDEIVAHLEYAYHNRKELLMYGRQAGLDLKHFTWGHSARRLIEVMGG